jgi:hypothetical protein
MMSILPRSSQTDWMPLMISDESGVVVSLSAMTATRSVGRPRSMRAAADGAKSSACMACSIRLRVFSDTLLASFSTRDTVLIDTPAFSATS